MIYSLVCLLNINMFGLYWQSMRHNHAFSWKIHWKRLPASVSWLWFFKHTRKFWHLWYEWGKGAKREATLRHLTHLYSTEHWHLYPHGQMHWELRIHSQRFTWLGLLIFFFFLNINSYDNFLAAMTIYFSALIYSSIALSFSAAPLHCWSYLYLLRPAAIPCAAWSHWAVSPICTTRSSGDGTFLLQYQNKYMHQSAANKREN